MASTYSDLKFELIGTGEQSGTWGVTTNTNIGTAIEEAITGSADVTFASGPVTLTLTNTNATQAARNLRLNLTGTSGGAQNLVVPSIEKFYLVNNGCADAITVKNSTGTGIAVPAGKAMLVFNNATDVVDAVNHFNTVSVGSLTLTNALAVAQGGTGATTADTALDNLGGTTVGKAVFKASTATAAQQAMDTEVGVDVQAYNSNLTTWAGITAPSGTVVGTTDTQTLTNKTFTGITETVYAVSGTTPAIADSNGTIQTWTLSGNSTPTDSLNAGESVTLMIDDGSAYTITWTSLVDQWIGGSAPTLATTGYSVVELWKVSTTVYGAYVGDAS